MIRFTMGEFIMAYRRYSPRLISKTFAATFDEFEYK